jgi:hypothetical protein
MISQLHEGFIFQIFYILYGSLDQRNPYSIIDAGEVFGAKSPPTRYDLATMAVRVVEFSNGGYKIRKIFA